MNPRLRTRFSIPLILMVATVFPMLTRSQEQQGPMAPPPKFEVKRIPSIPHPGPPPIPQEEIIKRLAANEDIMAKVYKTYMFTETISVEELSGPPGKFVAAGEVYTKPDGTQVWHAVEPLQSNLKTTTLTLEDVRTIASEPLFVLTSNEVGNYNFLYAGQDKLDELNTYVFQVKPKQLSRTRRFFEGAIWVDDHDLAIVKSYGKFVTEVEPTEGTRLPFTMFETYRENFQDKYWLPTYTSSDDYINSSNGDQFRLHLIIRSTDFKPNPQPPAPATPSGTSPSSSNLAKPSSNPQRN